MPPRPMTNQMLPIKESVTLSRMASVLLPCRSCVPVFRGGVIDECLISPKVANRKLIESMSFLMVTESNHLIKIRELTDLVLNLRGAYDG